MSEPWMALPSEDLRLRAVACVVEGGESPRDVAGYYGVSERSVWRWAAAWRDRGGPGLVDRPRPGRPPKLTPRQERQVLRWVDRSPCELGFVTERWTAVRLARVIADRLGVRMNPRYLPSWLRRRGVTPQLPQRRPRERDQAAVDAWVAGEWPAIKKRRPIAGRA